MKAYKSPEMILTSLNTADCLTSSITPSASEWELPIVKPDMYDGK